MNTEQYLLVKLAEEAAEVAQIAIKCAQFGLTEVYPEAGTPNVDRLFGEMNDLLGVFAVLHLEEVFSWLPDQSQITAKKDKIYKYLEYSRSLGQTGV